MRWVDSLPLSFGARFALGRSALELGTLKGDAELVRESVELHREAAELVPTSFRAWDRVADVYIVVGQPEEALKALEKSLAIVDGYEPSVSALLLQAEAYEKLGQIQPELESLEKAIKVRPKYPLPYFIRGSTYRLLGQHEKAIEDLNQAIILDPNYAQAYHSRALAFANLGRDDEANEDVERAVALGVARTALTEEIEEVKNSR